MAKRYVRADGYGNLPGFSPRGVYRIESEGDGYAMKELRQEGFGEEVEGPISQAGRRYLEAFGIRPEDVLRDGDTMTGYAAIVRDAEGSPIPDYGFKKRERRPWPENFDYERYVDLMLGMTSEHHIYCPRNGEHGLQCINCGDCQCCTETPFECPWQALTIRREGLQRAGLL